MIEDGTKKGLIVHEYATFNPAPHPLTEDLELFFQVLGTTTEMYENDLIQAVEFEPPLTFDFKDGTTSTRLQYEVYSLYKYVETSNAIICEYKRIMGEGYEKFYLNVWEIHPQFPAALWTAILERYPEWDAESAREGTEMGFFIKEHVQSEDEVEQQIKQVMQYLAITGYLNHSDRGTDGKLYKWRELDTPLELRFSYPHDAICTIEYGVDDQSVSFYDKHTSRNELEECQQLPELLAYLLELAGYPNLEDLPVYAEGGEMGFFIKEDLTDNLSLAEYNQMGAQISTIVTALGKYEWFYVDDLRIDLVLDGVRYEEIHGFQGRFMVAGQCQELGVELSHHEGQKVYLYRFNLNLKADLQKLAMPSDSQRYLLPLMHVYLVRTYPELLEGPEMGFYVKETSQYADYDAGLMYKVIKYALLHAQTTGPNASLFGESMNLYLPVSIALPKLGAFNDLTVKAIKGTQFNQTVMNLQFEVQEAGVTGEIYRFNYSEFRGLHHQAIYEGVLALFPGIQAEMLAREEGSEMGFFLHEGLTAQATAHLQDLYRLVQDQGYEGLSLAYRPGLRVPVYDKQGQKLDPHSLLVPYYNLEHIIIHPPATVHVDLKAPGVKDTLNGVLGNGYYPADRLSPALLEAVYAAVVQHHPDYFEGRELGFFLHENVRPELPAYNLFRYLIETYGKPLATRPDWIILPFRSPLMLGNRELDGLVLLDDQRVTGYFQSARNVSVLPGVDFTPDHIQTITARLIKTLKLDADFLESFEMGFFVKEDLMAKREPYLSLIQALVKEETTGSTLYFNPPLACERSKFGGYKYLILDLNRAGLFHYYRVDDSGSKQLVDRELENTAPWFLAQLWLQLSKYFPRYGEATEMGFFVKESLKAEFPRFFIDLRQSNTEQDEKVVAHAQLEMGFDITPLPHYAEAVGYIYLPHCGNKLRLTNNQSDENIQSLLFPGGVIIPASNFLQIPTREDLATYFEAAEMGFFVKEGFTYTPTEQENLRLIYQFMEVYSQPNAGQEVVPLRHNTASGLSYIALYPDGAKYEERCRYLTRTPKSYNVNLVVDTETGRDNPSWYTQQYNLNFQPERLAQLIAGLKVKYPEFFEGSEMGFFVKENAQVDTDKTLMSQIRQVVKFLYVTGFFTRSGKGSEQLTYYWQELTTPIRLKMWSKGDVEPIIIDELEYEPLSTDVVLYHDNTSYELLFCMELPQLLAYLLDLAGNPDLKDLPVYEEGAEMGFFVKESTDWVAHNKLQLNVDRVLSRLMPAPNAKGMAELKLNVPADFQHRFRAWDVLKSILGYTNTEGLLFYRLIVGQSTNDDTESISFTTIDPEDCVEVARCLEVAYPGYLAAAAEGEEMGFFMKENVEFESRELKIGELVRHFGTKGAFGKLTYDLDAPLPLFGTVTYLETNRVDPLMNTITKVYFRNENTEDGDDDDYVYLDEISESQFNSLYDYLDQKHPGFMEGAEMGFFVKEGVETKEDILAQLTAFFDRYATWATGNPVTPDNPQPFQKILFEPPLTIINSSNAPGQIFYFFNPPQRAGVFTWAQIRGNNSGSCSLQAWTLDTLYQIQTQLHARYPEYFEGAEMGFFLHEGYLPGSKELQTIYDQVITAFHALKIDRDPRGAGGNDLLLNYNTGGVEYLKLTEGTITTTIDVVYRLGNVTLDDRLWNFREWDGAPNIEQILKALQTQYPEYFEAVEMGFFVKESTKDGVKYPSFNLSWEMRIFDPAEDELRRTLWTRLKKLGFKNYQKFRGTPLQADARFWFLDGQKGEVNTSGWAHSKYPTLPAELYGTMSDEDVMAYLEGQELGFFIKEAATNNTLEWVACGPGQNLYPPSFGGKGTSFFQVRDAQTHKILGEMEVNLQLPEIMSLISYRKGVGRFAVDQLKNMLRPNFDVLYVLATTQSRPFWVKMGGVPTDPEPRYRFQLMIPLAPDLTPEDTHAFFLKESKAPKQVRVLINTSTEGEALTAYLDTQDYMWSTHEPAPDYKAWKIHGLPLVYFLHPDTHTLTYTRYDPNYTDEYDYNLDQGIDGLPAFLEGREMGFYLTESVDENRINIQVNSDEEYVALADYLDGMNYHWAGENKKINRLAYGKLLKPWASKLDYPIHILVNVPEQKIQYASNDRYYEYADYNLAQGMDGLPAFFEGREMGFFVKETQTPTWNVTVVVHPGRIRVKERALAMQTHLHSLGFEIKVESPLWDPTYNFEGNSWRDQYWTLSGDDTRIRKVTTSEQKPAITITLAEFLGMTWAELPGFIEGREMGFFVKEGRTTTNKNRTFKRGLKMEKRGALLPRCQKYLEYMFRHGQMQDSGLRAGSSRENYEGWHNIGDIMGPGLDLMPVAAHHRSIDALGMKGGAEQNQFYLMHGAFAYPLEQCEQPHLLLKYLKDLTRVKEADLDPIAEADEMGFFVKESIDEAQRVQHQLDHYLERVVPADQVLELNVPFEIRVRAKDDYVDYYCTLWGMIWKRNTPDYGADYISHTIIFKNKWGHPKEMQTDWLGMQTNTRLIAILAEKFPAIVEADEMGFFMKESKILRYTPNQREAGRQFRFIYDILNQFATPHATRDPQTKRLDTPGLTTSIYRIPYCLVTTDNGRLSYQAYCEYESQQGWQGIHHTISPNNTSEWFRRDVYTWFAKNYEDFAEGREMGFFVKESKAENSVPLPEFTLNFNHKVGEMWYTDTNATKLCWARLRRWGFENTQVRAAKPSGSLNPWWYVNGPHRKVTTMVTWSDTYQDLRVVKPAEILACETAQDFLTYLEGAEMGFFVKESKAEDRAGVATLLAEITACFEAHPEQRDKEQKLNLPTSRFECLWSAQEIDHVGRQGYRPVMKVTYRREGLAGGGQMYLGLLEVEDLRVILAALHTMFPAYFEGSEMGFFLAENSGWQEPPEIIKRRTIRRYFEAHCTPVLSGETMYPRERRQLWLPDHPQFKRLFHYPDEILLIDYRENYCPNYVANLTQVQMDALIAYLAHTFPTTADQLAAEAEGTEMGFFVKEDIYGDWADDDELMQRFWTFFRSDKGRVRFQPSLKIQYQDTLYSPVQISEVLGLRAQTKEEQAYNADRSNPQRQDTFVWRTREEGEISEYYWDNYNYTTVVIKMLKQRPEYGAFFEGQEMGFFVKETVDPIKIKAGPNHNERIDSLRAQIVKYAQVFASKQAHWFEPPLPISTDSNQTVYVYYLYHDLREEEINARTVGISYSYNPLCREKQLTIPHDAFVYNLNLEWLEALVQAFHTLTPGWDEAAEMGFYVKEGNDLSFRWHMDTKKIYVELEPTTDYKQLQEILFRLGYCWGGSGDLTPKLKVVYNPEYVILDPQHHTIWTNFLMPVASEERTPSLAARELFTGNPYDTLQAVLEMGAMLEGHYYDDMRARIADAISTETTLKGQKVMRRRENLRLRDQYAELITRIFKAYATPDTRGNCLLLNYHCSDSVYRTGEKRIDKLTDYGDQGELVYYIEGAAISLRYAHTTTVALIMDAIQAKYPEALEAAEMGML